jgi:hypothetical protein
VNIVILSLRYDIDWGSLERARCLIVENFVIDCFYLIPSEIKDIN